MSISDQPKDQNRSIETMTCFVIMPFGLKTDPYTKKEIDFDAIYRDLIKPTVEDNLKLICTRSDEVSQAGLIHKDMIDRIIESDVVIVDITAGNPNVMYELGVRHTARKSGTIIIRQKDSFIPFNIGGMRAMDYELGGHDSASNSYYSNLLETNIRNSLTVRNLDSLVHTLSPGLNVSRPATALKTRKTFQYAVRTEHDDKIIEIITGDIANIDTVDAWVNPENTRMEMGRLHDNSVSALIRYHGAKKDSRGHVVEDTIVKHLKKVLGRRAWAGVEPGTIVCTRAGQLEREDANRVKLLLHVAAQYSEPTQGYQTIRGYMRCMTNVLSEIDRQNNLGSKAVTTKGPIKSVIFPLFGTSGGDAGDAQDITYDLFRAAAEYLTTWPKTQIERVAFLAYTDNDLELCTTAAQRNELAPFSPSPKIGNED